MKTLILIRHAKSDWPENTEDIERPLTENGRKNAGKVSKALKEKDLKIDCLVTSPAKRTLETCEIFAREFDLKYSTADQLYNASEKQFLSTVFSLNDDCESVALFSHNNGISNFANSLTENIIHFPTCGVAIFNIECAQWSEFENATKKLAAFYSPKDF